MSRDNPRFTVAFDSVGTLFDPEPVRAELAAAGAPDLTLERWFDRALRDVLAWSMAGHFLSIEDALAAHLPALLPRSKTARTGPDQILGILDRLPVRAGAAECCRELVKRDVHVVCLTNADAERTTKLLERTGLSRYIREVRSGQEIRRPKPHPDVYLLARRDPGPVWMVSWHTWDVAGAAMAGLRAAWLAAGREWPDLEPEPDASFEQLAQVPDGLFEETATRQPPRNFEEAAYTELVTTPDDEESGGAIPDPDPDVVEKLGETFGVTYADNEPLGITEKVERRDRHRWETDPASDPEFQERSTRGEK